MTSAEGRTVPEAGSVATADDESRIALEVDALSKTFGTVRAVRSVGLRLRAGEIRAVLGLNGAGKSTLIKMLGGAVDPDEGTIAVGGNPVRFRSPADAMAQGIATVYQELTIVPGLSVAENIFLGRWPTRPGTGLDRRRMTREATALLHRVGATASPYATAGDLSIGDQQLVEIARALGANPHVLMLDEPTSSLSVPEADKLIALVRRLAETGVAIVYISHRMDEIRRVADSVTVMRDGALIDTVQVGSASTREIVTMMTGDRAAAAAAGTVSVRERRELPTDAPAALSVQDLGNEHLDGISFDLRQGEILGVAGVLGAGRTSLLRALAGADPSSGTVFVHGEHVGRRHLAAMQRRGIGLAPEDRKAQGLALSLSIRENLTLGCLPAISTTGIMSTRKEKSTITAVMDRLGVRWRPAAPPTTLSGGNQQRVVLGRWLANGARILLLDEPTRGVDVRAKREIYALLTELAEQGVSTLFSTSEFDELYHVADRSLVLRRGRLVADVDLHEVDEEHLMLVAMGDGEDHDG
jgi:sugar transport system ATP-binding protein